MNIKAFLGLIILTNVLFANIQNKKYSISVCTTSTLEYATTCKKRIENSSVNNIVFIVKERKNRFQTYLGLFDSEKKLIKLLRLAQIMLNNKDHLVKKLIIIL